MSASLLTRRDCVGTVARFWQRTYATHHLTLITLLTLNILTQLFLTPHYRLIRLSDPTIQYPHADPETITPLFLFLYGVVLPLVIIIFWILIARLGGHTLHVSLLGLGLSILATGLVTDVIKNSVGRPRPDLLARCRPDESIDRDALVGVEVCTTNGHLLHDGWRSFPSGHSSLSFSGLGYLSLFLTAQTRALSHTTPLPLALLPLLPLLGAALIAISRTADYRHDVFDVCTGSILGAIVALGSYRRYYPSLWARGAEKPWPPPDVNMKGASSNGKDEEEFVLGEGEGEYERVDGDEGEGPRR
ncbi:MAG: hypothetical protein Q9159_001481 [Coniocarpon cinnabarinum]